MIQQTPQVDRFKQQLRASLQREVVPCRSATIAKHARVYTYGEQDETVYFIESGQIKLLMLAPFGREWLLAIHTAGDIFGELWLSGLGERQETAMAMQTTVVRRIPCAQFFLCLSCDALLAGFVQYLAVRIADQQATIANLVTVDSEQRLWQTFLHLAQARPARPAHHSHRTTDYPRRIVRDGGHDAKLPAEHSRCTRR